MTDAGGLRSGEPPAPPKPTIMRQRWRDVSFAHWRVEPSVVARLLPPSLEVDTFDGSAWLSLVGFEMDGLRLAGAPPIPTTARFPEFNVRTYVRGPVGPGVWFHSLDIPHWLPTLVARAAFALPYCRARVESYRTERLQAWEVRRQWPNRTTGALALAPGAAIERPDDLDVFLTARWRLYASTRGGRLVTAAVHHERWPLHTAELVDLDTRIAHDVTDALDREPLLHHSPGVSVRVGRPTLL